MTEHTLYRPPAERDSLLLRVADGCPHNRCLFCAMYRDVPYRIEDPALVRERIALASYHNAGARRVFLADGDVLALSMAELSAILDQLRTALPRLTRVSCYASGRSLAAKTDADLRILRGLGLHTLYLGLESGDEDVLRAMAKASTAREMHDGCRRAQDAGLCVSVMVLIGLGGQERSAAHVEATIRVVNAMQPRHLSCLRLMPIPGTPLAQLIRQGRFTPLSEELAVRELRKLISGLRLTHTVFRADHSSNIMPLSGRLPKDQPRLMEELEELLACGVLDTRGPGPMPHSL